jgi:uncharacterized membrane protein
VSTWLFLVHWLHVLGGMVWLGGVVIAYFVIWPALLRRPVPEARATFKTIEPLMRRVMEIAAQLVIWLGLIRGTWLGPIDAFGDLTGTPYGHAFLGAIGLTVGFAVASAVISRRIEERVWDGATIRAGAAAYVRRSGVISVALLLGVAALMARMRFGL